MVRAPESPWSLRATRTLPGVSGISPSLLESFLAAPRSLLESWGNAGVSLESPSVPRVSLESFPASYAGWIGKYVYMCAGVSWESPCGIRSLRGVSGSSPSVPGDFPRIPGPVRACRSVLGVFVGPGVSGSLRSSRSVPESFSPPGASECLGVSVEPGVSGSLRVLPECPRDFLN